MYIVLDSNIWLSELGLNTSKGAATRFYVKQKQAKLALPEIIKEEVERNLYNALSIHSDDIKKNHRQLLAVFGQLKEVVLPSEEDIKTRADSLFNEVKVELLQIPFTLESAKSSLNKINDKKPPSDKSQQFKDGVIWADCMNLLENDDVFLVTEDKAFFHDRSYKSGLAANLRDEASTSANEFKIYSSLTELLEEIKTDVVIDNAALVSQFTETIEESVNSILERNGFSISSEASVKILPFVTEDPDKMYIEFSIHFECIDTRDEGRTDGVLLLKGDGYYASDKKELLELRNRGEELSFNDGSEERKNVNHVLLAGNIVLGHRNVEHSVRYRIE
jgi:hypothetical protein